MRPFDYPPPRRNRDRDGNGGILWWAAAALLGLCWLVDLFPGFFGLPSIR